MCLTAESENFLLILQGSDRCFESISSIGGAIEWDKYPEINLTVILEMSNG